MPDDATAVLDSAPAPAQADTPPAEAEASSTTAPAGDENPQSLDEVMDAAYESIGDKPAESEKPPEQQAGDEPAGTDEPKVAAPEAAKPTFALSDEDKQLLRRMHYPEAALPTDPVAAMTVLRHLERTQSRLDAEFAARGKPQAEPEKPDAQPRAAANAPASATAQELEAEWAKLGDDLYTDDGPKKLKALVEKTVAALQQPTQATEQVSQLMRIHAQREFKQGLDLWEAPAGVDKSNDLVREKIRDQTSELLALHQSRGTSFADIDLQALTVQAASLAFPLSRNQAADRQRQKATEARRGSPAQAGRAPNGQFNKPSLDSVYDDWARNNPPPK